MVRQITWAICLFLLVVSLAVGRAGAETVLVHPITLYQEGVKVENLIRAAKTNRP